ncbi:MAG TPA: hypothetical protein VHW01_12515 [Polyangiaceae bacterium]|jgi:hypothetical protein|nr:hypothetical protein [Polyangiaceae bacterium]
MAEKSKKNQLDSMTITPAKNGGHTVKHSYKARPTMRKGHFGGGMGMDYPQSEEHVFGPGDGAKMLAHVKANLGLQAKGASGDAIPGAEQEAYNAESDD